MRLIAATTLSLLAFLACPCQAFGRPPASRSSSDSALTVPPQAIRAENAFWRRLGVTPPRDGIVLEHPWSKPWSGRSMIVPAQWFLRAFRRAGDHRRSGKPMMINAVALRKDLPILHTVLEKNYIGWEVASRRGWNWDAWFRRWNAMLAAHGNRLIPDPVAFAPWNTFESFQIDSHSGPHVTSRSMPISRSAMLASAPDAPCTELQNTAGKLFPLSTSDPAQQPHRVMRWNGHRLQAANYVVYPSSRGTVRNLVCGGHHIAATPFWNSYSSKHGKVVRDAGISALDGGQKGLSLYHSPAPGIGYLRLSDFAEAGDQALVNLVKELPKSAGHEKVLIVDLRGNDGGASPIDALSRWIPVDTIHLTEDQTSKTSCLHAGLWFNLFQVMSLKLKPPTTTGFRKMAKHMLASIRTPATQQCPVTFHTTHGHWFYRQHRFIRHWRGHRPRLLVLVDDHCASDCEYMTWQLAQLPGTVIAGSNTLGVIGFTQPGFMLLPHTHIIFQLATSRTEPHGDGRSEDGYGLDVDVTLSKATDWSSRSILALARTLESPEKG